MRKTVKLLAMLLALLMLVSMVVACGGTDTPDAGESESGTSGSNDVDGTGEETTKEIVTDKYGQQVYDNEIPEDLDYNGKEVHIFIRSGEQYRREWNCKEVSNSLDQEIYYRNLEVEERIGIKLDYNVLDEGKGCETITNAVRNAANAGNGSVDIVSHYAAYGANTTLMQYYKDWNSDDLKYLNLDRNYWNQNFIKGAETFGKLFLCVGDVNLSVYDRSIVVFFNKKLVENDYADRIGDLYQTVIDGDWTYDLMYQYVKDVNYDPGTPEDPADNVYGLASIKGSEASDGFLYSWDCWLTETDANGMHRLVTDTAYTKLESAFGKMIDIWYNSNGAYMLGNSGDNTKFFTTGHAIFDIDVMYHYASHNTDLRAMEDGFGIIPLPKYDEDQTEYYAGVQDAHNVMGIVNNGMKSNFEMISATLELLCSINYEKVRPWYISQIVKGQFLDLKSGECFEMVLNGTRWDYADIYAASVGGVRNNIWRGPFGKNASFASTFESVQSNLNGSLSDMDVWLNQQNNS